MECMVSIILPNYNYSRFLKERIDSIMNQELQDFEIIVLDDASSDNSVQILDELAKNPKVSHYVVNKRNSGSPFAQWKKGFELAKGKYIWIAEADDSSTPYFLKTAVDVMENDPELALCYTGSTVVDEDGKELYFDYTDWDAPRMKRRVGTVQIHQGRDFIRHNMYWGCYVYNASATLFRRSLVTSEMFEESAGMKNSGDWLFWTKLAGKGKVGEIYEKLSILRRHASATTNVGEKTGNIYFEDPKVLAYIESNYNPGVYRKIIRHGTFIKKVLRSGLDDKKIKDILMNFHNLTGGGMGEYRFERIHKALSNLLPFLISKRNDRL